MTKPITLIDVDNVIAFFTPHFVSVAEKVLNKAYELEKALAEFDIGEALALTKEESDLVYEALHQPGVAESLEPMELAIESVKDIASMTDVYFVTKQMRGSKTWAYEREKWLIDHFGELGKKVIFTGHKHLIYGKYLIEDSAYNAVKWEEFQRSHGNSFAQALLLKHPYNEHERRVRKFDGWKELTEEIAYQIYGPL